MFVHYADVVYWHHWGLEGVGKTGDRDEYLIHSTLRRQCTIMLMTQLPAVDGHCAFLIARLNSNPSREKGEGGKKEKRKAIHRL